MNRVPAAIFLAMLLAGCPKRIDFGQQGEQQDVRELLALTAQAEKGVYAVQGEAKIRVDSPQAKGVVTLFMAVTHPALLHLESLDFFGKPQAVLVSDGQTFSLYRADEAKFFRGPATAENIGRFLPVALPPTELTALLLGRAPRIPYESAELELDREAQAYRVKLHHGAVTQVLLIHPGHHRVLASELKGVDSYALAFEEFRKEGQALYPRKVVLRSQAAQATLELLYRDVTLNEAPDLTLYELEPPPGVKVVEVDERGNPRDSTGP